MSAFVTLMYHNLDHEPRHEYAVRPADFDRQLAWLSDQGFTVEGFPELEKRLQDASEFPPRYCVLSFDDGHVSNLDAARRVLRAGFQATFFITRSATRERPGFLDEAGVRELAGLCSVGSHTLSHRSLCKLPAGELRQELLESRVWLERLVERPVRWLSAPGGDLGRRELRAARELGYTLVGDSIEWWNRPARLERTGLVHRTMVYASYGLADFARLLERRPSFFLRRRLRSAAVGAAKRWLPEETVLRLSRWKRRF